MEGKLITRKLRQRLLPFVLATVIITLHYIGVLQPIEGVFVRVIRPVQEVAFGWLSPSTSEGSGAEVVQKLEREIARLLVDNAALLEQQRRIDAEVTAQSLLEQFQISGVVATVIGRSPEGDDQVLLLNRGREQGIREGQPVIVENGVLVGTIVSVESERSHVLLVTSDATTIAAEVANDTRSPGIVEGSHALTMTLSFVPQSEQIEVGQRVLTSNVNARIPANLLIGTITAVLHDPGDVFQQSPLSTLFDVQQLRYVTVLQTS